MGGSPLDATIECGKAADQAMLANGASGEETLQELRPKPQCSVVLNSVSKLEGLPVHLGMLLATSSLSLEAPPRRPLYLQAPLSRRPVNNSDALLCVCVCVCLCVCVCAHYLAGCFLVPNG
jgi:hypothetical protein